MISSIFVYLSTFYMLKSMGGSEQITKNDRSTFGLVSIGIVSTGIVFTIMYQLLVKEPTETGLLRFK